MMRKGIGVLGIIGVATVLVSTIACTNGEAASVKDDAQVAIQVDAPVDVGMPRIGTDRMPMVSAQVQSMATQTGISVSGEGVVSLEPDLAIVTVGVEARAATVAQARSEAAEAMSNIVEAVRIYGLTGRDIRTTQFNIWPQYEYEEVMQGRRRVSKQILVGYTVSNSVAIKVRDLDNIGPAIDDVAKAGGDLTRINGINFTVEDPNPFMDQLRKAAVLDAIAKAEQYANLTGVVLGRLVFLREGSSTTPEIRPDFSVRAAFAEDSMAPTPISAGETELRLTVSTVFALQ